MRGKGAAGRRASRSTPESSHFDTALLSTTRLRSFTRKSAARSNAKRARARERERTVRRRKHRPAQTVKVRAKVRLRKSNGRVTESSALTLPPPPLVAPPPAPRPLPSAAPLPSSRCLRRRRRRRRRLAYSFLRCLRMQQARGLAPHNLQLNGCPSPRRCSAPPPLPRPLSLLRRLCEASTSSRAPSLPRKLLPPGRSLPNRRGCPRRVPRRSRRGAARRGGRAPAARRQRAAAARERAGRGQVPPPPPLPPVLI